VNLFDTPAGPTHIKSVQAQIAETKQQIALAKDKRAGLEAAIKSREKHLARLEAQLVMMSPAGQSSSVIVA
jgi:septal ring factor EnvC (AmiA/AmiB activator)